MGLPICYTLAMDSFSSQQQPQISTGQSAVVYRRIATLFLALTAGVMLLAAYVVFSRADVVVLSEQEEIKADIIIDVARSPGEKEVKGDVFELADSLTQTFPSASVVGIDQPARGKVRISSSLGRAQTLIATTRLFTEGDVLFRIRDTVTVPANGSVEVNAFATEAGAKGQVPDGTSFTIPGLNADLRKLFKVKAAGAFTSDKKDMRMITQSDIENAAAVLRIKLVDKLTESLREAAKTAGAPTDGELVVVSFEGRTTDAVVGADKPEFSMTVSTKISGVFYDKAAFDAQVRRRLGDKLMEGRALLTVDESSFERRIEKKDLVAGRANVGVVAKGSSILSARAPGLETSKLTGVSVEAAQAYLQTVDGVASASITARPFWAGRMPNVAEHIKVEVR